MRVRGELRGLYQLAWPVVVTQLGMMGMGVVDTVMMGRYGPDSLAAVAMANNYTFGVMIVPLGILMGLDPLTSQAWGAGRVGDCGHLLRRGLLIALLLSLPLMAAWCLTAPALALLDQPAQLLPDAGSYALWLLPGALPILAFQCLRQTLQAIGAVRPIMLVALLANLFNALADWALIYGRLGLPELGVAGAGIATSLSRWFLFGGLLALGLASGQLQRVRPTAAADEGLPSLGRIFRLGLPIGLQYGLEVWMFGIVGFFMGWLGAIELAGHQIALNLVTLSFTIPMGLSVAASVRVGQAIGRRDPDGARLAAWVALGCGVAVMAVSATVFATIPRLLAGLYTTDPGLIAVAALLLPMGALFQLFDGTQAVGFGLLRGTGDTSVPMLINLLGYYVVALPLGWWLTFRSGWGPRGPWAALVIGLSLVAMLIVARLWHQLRGELLPIGEQRRAPRKVRDAG